MAIGLFNMLAFYCTIYHPKDCTRNFTIHLQYVVQYVVQFVSNDSVVILNLNLINDVYISFSTFYRILNFVSTAMKKEDEQVYVFVDKNLFYPRQRG